MKRELLLAPFGAHDTTERLLKQALALVPGPDFRSITYLTPSPRKLDDTRYRFARLCGRPAFIPPVFLTPGQLARSLHDSAGAASPLSAALRPLLVRRLVHGDQPTLGLARAYADFIAEVKMWVPRPRRAGLRDLFTDELAGFERPLARALEALDVLDRYDAELAARGRVDDEDVWQAAPALAALRPIGVLVLDGFAAPDPLEQGLLAALIEGAETTLAACFSGEDGDPDYELAGRFRVFIEGLGGFAFERSAAPAAPIATLYSCPDREAELAAICHHLLGRPDLTDTVVALPDLQQSAPLVARIFEQYGIPATFYPEQNLDTSPPVTDVLELLRALDSDFERLPTAVAFSSHWLPGLLRLTDDTGDAARTRAAGALNNVSRRAGIIKGGQNWEHVADRLRAAEGEPAGADAQFILDLQARVVRALDTTRQMLGRAGALGAQAKKLKELLGRVHYAGEPDAEHDPLLADRGSFYDLLDELVEFDADFGPASEPRSGFIRTIEYLAGLAGRKSEPPPAGVLVIKLDETIGLHPGHVVVGGLTEKNLPGARATDPILPDRLRRRLGMRDVASHRDWQRFNLRRTIESSRTTPFLSLPESDDGQPMLPTPLLDLVPVRLAADPAPASKFERQLAEGADRGRPFAESLRAVDFSGDPAVAAALSARFGPQRRFSVTGLEAYRACPHRFYLERVLGLASPPEPQYEIDAAQWGSVIHAAMHELYRRGPVPLARLAERARAALDSALREAGLAPFWAETARRVFDNLLPRIVEVETGLRDEGWAPSEVELAVEGSVADDLLVRGRLDRLDSGPGGLRVIDYKTGSAGINAKSVIEKRTHIQLPLYARLIAGERRQPVENVGVFSLRDGRLHWLAAREVALEELIRVAVETAIEAAQRIRAGDFADEPADPSTCRTCDFGFLCRPDAEAGE